MVGSATKLERSGSGPFHLVQIGCRAGDHGPRTAQAVSVPGPHPQLKVKEALTMMFDIVIFLRGHNSLSTCAEVLALFVHVVVMTDFCHTKAASHASPYPASSVISLQAVCAYISGGRTV